MFCISDVFEIWLYTCILFVFHRWPWNIWLDLDLFVLTLTCWIFPFNLFLAFSLFTCDELTIYMSISWLIFCEICFIFMQFFFKRKLMLDFFFPNWMTYILFSTFIALTLNLCKTWYWTDSEVFECHQNNAKRLILLVVFLPVFFLSKGTLCILLVFIYILLIFNGCVLSIYIEQCFTVFCFYT